MLGRSQPAGGEVVVDLVSRLSVLDGSDGGGHVHHQVRQILVTRPGEMNPVSAPLDIAFDAVVRVRVVRGVEPQRGRRQGRALPPAQIPLAIAVILMYPDLPQDLHLPQHPQTRRGIGRPGRSEQLLPVPAELLGALAHRCLAARNFSDLDFPAVTFGPLGLNQRHQPVRIGPGNLLQRRPHALARQLQPGSTGAPPPGHGWRRYAVALAP